MRYLPTGEQMRAADLYTIEQMGMPSLVLMERAALGVVEMLEHEHVDMRKILVVCGAGNNGGDGYAAARILHLKGYKTELYFAGNEEARSEENRRQMEIAAHYHVPVVDTLENREYSMIVDAIFGTGLKREITGSYRELIDTLNGMSGVKAAVDIPSGVHDTDGRIMGTAFRADLTAAIAFEKRGMMLYPGYSYAGKITVTDIGITADALLKTGRLTYTLEREDLQARLPERRADSHKGTYGKVLLVVGSAGMSGAAYLSAKAAYAVGAGLVRIYTAEANREILQQQLPEAVISTYETFEETQLLELLQWADAVGIGCGLGTGKTAQKLMEYTLRYGKNPCVIDADGLNLLAGQAELLCAAEQELILTPHMKEMTRLLQCEMKQLREERIPQLMEFAEQNGCVTVLKDARTLVAEKHRNIYLNLSGNAAMAKGGSGDVLAGMITGFLAQKVSGYDAAVLGVYLHGLAGDAARDKRGAYSVLAGDLTEGISDVLKGL